MGLMTEARRISVVVPTCDRPELLRDALASIRAVENAELSFEILVGDNGSSPETPRLAEEFGAVHLKVDKRGAGAARNAAFRAATGEFIAFLDDDDIWRPGHIADHVAALDAHPELAAVISQAILTDTERRPYETPWPETAPEDSEDLLRLMLSGLFPQLGTVVARRGVIDRFGYFDEGLIFGQDLDWLLRMARARELGYVDFLGTYVRARPPGSFDALQRRRVGYDRKVFLRHAIPEWRVWRSPVEFLRAHSKVLWHFYTYFEKAALERAEGGDRRGSWGAIGGAFRVFPLRAAAHLVMPTPLRQAFLTNVMASLGLRSAT
jgi:glycosyltransferase involved in cell wall biosynthesis